MLKRLEGAMAEMQRDQAATMLTFEQRHWAALLGNEQRIMERIEEGNVQVVAALALKLDSIQVTRGCDHLLLPLLLLCLRGRSSQGQCVSTEPYGQKYWHHGLACNMRMRDGAKKCAE